MHSIVYETYLELRPGKGEAELADGDASAPQAASGVDLLEAVQLFDRKARRDLRRTAVGAGIGLAGRGRGLNSALADTPAAGPRPLRPAGRGHARGRRAGPHRRRRLADGARRARGQRATTSPG